MHLLLLFTLLLVTSLSWASSAKIAIMIDDIGYRTTDKQALSLPPEIAYAILPHTPFGKKLAIKAQQQRRDIFLHIPMEAENGKTLGPGGLTSDMTEQQVNHQLTAAIEEIPFAIGINNHMGSKLTQQYQKMLWIMQFIKNNNLLFLDSRTTRLTQAVHAAEAIGVPVNRRNIFLDNQLDDAHIEQQFSLLINEALKKGQAIALAHPHPETISALNRLLPTLTALNIELVPISSLYQQKTVNDQTPATE